MTPATDGPRETDAELAPRWHTGLLVALILGYAVVGAATRGRVGPSSPDALPPGSSRIAALYAPMLAALWLQCAYVVRAPRHLRRLLGPRWATARGLGGDVAIAALFAGAVEAVEIALASSSLGAPAAYLAAIVPATAVERIVWVAVALSAGFCEEVVYRGYLQAQLGAFTRSPRAGVVLQGVLFGIAHGEQGWGIAARFALYGVAFGALARWRRTLRPGVMCHAGIDLIGGLLGR
jgi:membrane protease YdiL (CAAX protease family)